MIFVTAYTPLDSAHYREQYERFAKKGIDKQPDPKASLVVDAKGGLADAYEVARRILLDRPPQPVAFIHADLEIMDDEFTAKVMKACEDPEVACVGFIGARRPQSIAWWEGEGVGQMHHGRQCNIQPGVYFKEHEGEVDALDGCGVVLSPWGLRNLTFDAENFPAFHGWDVDVTTLARSLGKKVVVIDSEARHHTKGGYGDRAAYERANVNYRLKWGRFILTRRSK